jgi:hypothetical protein
MRTALLWLLLTSTAFADGLTVSVESPGPIVATLTLPKEGEHTIEKWAADNPRTKWTTGPSEYVQHVWADAGTHRLAVKGYTAVFNERDILVPGPNWATDKTDVRLEKLRYLVDKTPWTHGATFVVEGHAPNPPPDDPEIDPTVPTVPVDPNAPKITVDGFHVLVLYSDATQPALYELLNDPQVRAYLDSHCQGGAAGWRVWEEDVPLTNALPVFKEMRAYPQPSRPALNIAVNKRLIQAEVPKTAIDLLALLKKYGGA